MFFLIIIIMGLNAIELVTGLIGGQLVGKKLTKIF